MLLADVPFFGVVMLEALLLGLELHVLAPPKMDVPVAPVAFGTRTCNIVA